MEFKNYVSYLDFFPQTLGARGGYEPEGRGVDSQWCQEFSLT
jgi:hypothetical protein